MRDAQAKLKPPGSEAFGEDGLYELERKTVRRLRRIFYGSLLLCVFIVLDLAFPHALMPQKYALPPAFKLPLLLWAIVITVYVFITLSAIERKARERAESMEGRDVLTGAYSLAYSVYALQEMRSITPHGVRELAVGYVHITGIENVNMRYGHAAGSIAVKNIAQIISDALPYGALLCRMGGAEFAAFMPETKVTEAWATLTKIQESVRALEVDLGDRGKAGGLAARIGLIVDKGGRPPEDLMRDAAENASASGPPQEGA